ncbi:MAG TPA: hypothetical protein PLY87_26705, partial [Planctomycetaceae bacterium]|nr:hypothetical protein [Planctomycetaceae bacterium]
RGSSLGTGCSGGSCLPGFSLEAGASSALRSKAGALERGLTAFIPHRVKYSFRLHLAYDVH